MTKIISKGARTRARILEEAPRLFAKRGVDATSLKDIAAEVGISEPAIYRHFTSKADLVWQLFSTNYCGLADTMYATAQAETNLRGKLDRIIEVYCKLHDTDALMFRFLFLTQHGQLERIIPDMRTPVTVMIDMLAAGMGQKEIPKRDPQLLAAIVIGLLVQPAVFHMYGRLTGTMSRHRKILANAAWAAISA